MARALVSVRRESVKRETEPWRLNQTTTPALPQFGACTGQLRLHPTRLPPFLSRIQQAAATFVARTAAQRSLSSSRTSAPARARRCCREESGGCRYHIHNKGLPSCEARGSLSAGGQKKKKNRANKLFFPPQKP